MTTPCDFCLEQPMQLEEGRAASLPADKGGAEVPLLLAYGQVDAVSGVQAIASLQLRPGTAHMPAAAVKASTLHTTGSTHATAGLWLSDSTDSPRIWLSNGYQVSQIPCHPLILPHKRTNTLRIECEDGHIFEHTSRILLRDESHDCSPLSLPLRSEANHHHTAL